MKKNSGTRYCHSGLRAKPTASPLGERAIPESMPGLDSGIFASQKTGMTYEKRTRLLAMAIIMLTAAFITLSEPAFAADNPSIVNFKGTIVKVMGDAKVRPAAGTEWVAAKQGMELSVEDQIMTSKGATVDIMFKRNDQRSTVRVLEEADMSLMTLNLDKVTGESEILLDLAIGHIIIKTDPLKGKSRFEVLTPTSMTAVRGTVFEVNVVKSEDPSHLASQ